MYIHLRLTSSYSLHLQLHLHVPYNCVYVYIYMYSGNVETTTYATALPVLEGCPLKEVYHSRTKILFDYWVEMCTCGLGQVVVLHREGYSRA